MPLKTNPELKLYYSISEVARMFSVQESTLRYWEKEFDVICPSKTAAGVRQYRKEDIENVRLVHHLVKECGLTIAGAKQRIKGGVHGETNAAAVIERLKAIRKELADMRRELDYLT